jgi:type 1 glutamine amidotransferase
MTTRINARIDDELGQQIEMLRRRSGKTITEIVEAALRAWTSKELEVKQSPAEIFAATGFIGCGSGPADLARNSKKYLTESLKRKA